MLYMNKGKTGADNFKQVTEEFIESLSVSQPGAASTPAAFTELPAQCLTLSNTGPCHRKTRMTT